MYCRFYVHVMSYSKIRNYISLSLRGSYNGGGFFAGLFIREITKLIDNSASRNQNNREILIKKEYINSI